MTRQYSTYRTVDHRWLQVIPAHWSITRLRYICDIATGSGDTVNAEPDGEYPFIVRSPNPLRAPTFDHESEAILTVGDGAVGEVFHHIRGGKFLAHQRVYVLNNFRDVDSRFLFHYFSALFRLMAQDGSARTTVDSVRRWMLTDMPVALPPGAEQRAIADYLDRETARIDTLIEEQQRLIELLRERRDGVVTKTFLNSTCEERKLKFTVDDVTVGIVVQPSRWYVDTGVPALRGVNVKRGSISLADLVNISEEGHAAHLKSRLCSGDVVVVRTGQAGAAAKIPDELDGANAIDILIVRPGQYVLPDYLVWYLNSPLAASRIEHGSVGALQGHFNVSALRELPLPDAPVAEQQRIVAYLDERVTKIDTTIAETERFIELARERRAALITAAVTGQIDVRETG